MYLTGLKASTYFVRQDIVLAHVVVRWYFPYFWCLPRGSANLSRRNPPFPTDSAETRPYTARSRRTPSQKEQSPVSLGCLFVTQKWCRLLPPTLSLSLSSPTFPHKRTHKVLTSHRILGTPAREKKFYQELVHRTSSQRPCKNKKGFVTQLRH